MDDLSPLVAQAGQSYDAARTPAELEDAKARFLGKGGELTAQMKLLATLPVDEKKARGAEVKKTSRMADYPTAPGYGSIVFVPALTISAEGEHEPVDLLNELRQMAHTILDGLEGETP